jgi:putative restriction endonuclease
VFDTPVFKILAANDTGKAVGHQGGFVIPKEIEGYFPDIAGELTAMNPTVEAKVIADLIVRGKLIASVTTRYQYQSWGGTRFERRLTSGLGPLRDAASAGDIVLFSRGLDQLDRMTLTLIEAGTAEHKSILAKSGSRRWGPVPGLVSPVSNSDIRFAEDEILKLKEGAFALTSDDRPIAERLVRQKVRDTAFRRQVVKEYGERCLACGESIISPSAGFNLDAAHIVPVELGGTDDPRNGLLLSKDLHWAFDKGLFGISDTYDIIVPASLIAGGKNLPLARLAARKLEFGQAKLRPHGEALAWHRKERLLEFH